MGIPRTVPGAAGGHGGREGRWAGRAPIPLARTLARRLAHSPKAGRAQRGRPPCCTASPRGHFSSSSDPSGTLEGSKGPEGSWGRGRDCHSPPPSAPQLRPHLPPGKQQEEQRRRRGWRWEGGGKEPEPEPPDGVGVGGRKPMPGLAVSRGARSPQGRPPPHNAECPRPGEPRPPAPRPRPPPERRGLLRGRRVKGHCPGTGAPPSSAGRIPHLPHASQSPRVSGGPGLPPMAPSRAWRGRSRKGPVPGRGRADPREGRVQWGEAGWFHVHCGASEGVRRGRRDCGRGGWAVGFWGLPSKGC